MFDELVGLRFEKTYIESLLDKGETKSAFLFCGPSGCGKTTFANLVVEEIVSRQDNPSYLIKPINCANDNGIEMIRAWSESIKHRALQKYHFAIFDEAHRLTPQAWDALLKVLDELPNNTHVFFCTTSDKNIPETILSRLYVLYFSKPSKEDLRTIIFLNFSFAILQSCTPEDYEYIANELCNLSGGNIRELKKLINEFSIYFEKSGHDELTIFIFNHWLEKKTGKSTGINIEEFATAVLTCIDEQKEAEFELNAIFDKLDNAGIGINEFLKEYHKVLHREIINCQTLNPEFNIDMLKDQLYKLVVKESLMIGKENYSYLKSLFILDIWGTNYA